MTAPVTCNLVRIDGDDCDAFCLLHGGVGVERSELPVVGRSATRPEAARLRSAARWEPTAWVDVSKRRPHLLTRGHRRRRAGRTQGSTQVVRAGRSDVTVPGSNEPADARPRGSSGADWR
jgi:hypothetical protein